MKYLGEQDYQHGSAICTGVLLVNLGTPESPTPRAVRRYLREFLSDPRVVEYPRALWWLVLNGIILNLRPRRSAHAYRQVWTPEGSPLLAISRRQKSALQAALRHHLTGPVEVALGMRYGEPSIAEALATLKQAGAQRLLVVPLYPQYSATTTGSVFDAVADELKRWRWVPELRFIQDYHDDPGYIAALAASVRAYWDEHGRGEYLLMSFHGVPKRYFQAGDPYHCLCLKTARLVAEALELGENDWQCTFQSRFGREEWLRPYTDETLRTLPQQGKRRVDVVCPGFAADCLETLEEIAMQNRDVFLASGGEAYRYIPALNDSPEHIEALSGLVERHAQGWPEAAADWDPEDDQRRRAESAARAQRYGANR
ncbi:MAG: ferrochelatase [Gammaproteobacteria bacterium]|jgi:ferrochelatase